MILKACLSEQMDACTYFGILAKKKSLNLLWNKVFYNMIIRLNDMVIHSERMCSNESTMGKNNNFDSIKIIFLDGQIIGS